MGFFKTKPPAIPKNPNVFGHCSSSGWQARIEPLSNFQKFFGQSIWRVVAGKGPTPGVETPLTPDEADVLDAGDGVEGYGVDGLALGLSSASGCGVFSWYWQVNRPKLVESGHEYL